MTKQPPPYKPKSTSLEVASLMGEHNHLAREASDKLRHYKPSALALEVASMVQDIQQGNPIRSSQPLSAEIIDDGNGNAMSETVSPAEREGRVYPEEDKKEDSQGDTDTDANSKYRDVDLETAQQAEQQHNMQPQPSYEVTQIEDLQAEDSAMSSIGVGAVKDEGYSRDIELSKGDSATRQKASHKRDKESYLDRPDKQHSSGRLHSFLSWRNAKKVAMQLLQKTQEKMVNAKFLKELDKKYMRTHVKDVQKEVERLSTHRHHAVVAPGNQAGIFDNKIEKERKKLEKKKDNMNYADNGVAFVSMQEVLQVEPTVKKDIGSSKDVEKQELGKFTHDALLQQQKEVDKTRGML